MHKITRRRYLHTPDIYQVGYTGVTSYAYPGGLRLKVINPQ